MYDDLSDDPVTPLRFNSLTLGILATLVWMVLAGLWVQHRYDVPSLTEYKASAEHVLACRPQGGPVDVVQMNRCLEGNYDRLLGAWRQETGLMVVLPPMLAWIVALLHNLTRELGLFRCRKEA